LIFYQKKPERSLAAHLRATCILKLAAGTILPMSTGSERLSELSMSLVDDIELLVKRNVLKIREVKYSDSGVKIGEHSYRHFLIIDTTGHFEVVDAIVLYGFFKTVIRSRTDEAEVSVSWKDARRIKNLAKSEQNSSLSDKYAKLVEDSNSTILKEI